MKPGARNAYFCPTCKGYTITVDVDEGVTPMFLGCRATGDVVACGGRAESLGYPPEPWPMADPGGRQIPQTPMFEWYRPDEVELRDMSAEMVEHVGKGGLALRPVTT